MARRPRQSEWLPSPETLRLTSGRLVVACPANVFTGIWVLVPEASRSDKSARPTGNRLGTTVSLFVSIEGSDAGGGNEFDSRQTGLVHKEPTSGHVFGASLF